MGPLHFLEEGVETVEIEVPAPGHLELGLESWSWVKPQTDSPTRRHTGCMVAGVRSRTGNEGKAWGAMGQQAEQVRKG